MYEHFFELTSTPDFGIRCRGVPQCPPKGNDKLAVEGYIVPLMYIRLRGWFQLLTRLFKKQPPRRGGPLCSPVWNDDKMCFEWLLPSNAIGHASSILSIHKFICGPEIRFANHDESLKKS